MVLLLTLAGLLGYSAATAMASAQMVTDKRSTTPIRQGFASIRKARLADFLTLPPDTPWQLLPGDRSADAGKLALRLEGQDYIIKVRRFPGHLSTTTVSDEWKRLFHIEPAVKASATKLLTSSQQTLTLEDFGSSGALVIATHRGQFTTFFGLTGHPQTQEVKRAFVDFLRAMKIHH